MLHWPAISSAQDLNKNDGSSFFVYIYYIHVCCYIIEKCRHTLKYKKSESVCSSVSSPTMIYMSKVKAASKRSRPRSFFVFLVSATVHAHLHYDMVLNYMYFYYNMNIYHLNRYGKRIKFLKQAWPQKAQFSLHFHIDGIMRTR